MLSRLKPICNIPISNINKTIPSSNQHPPISEINYQYSTKVTCRFKGKAIKDLANDDTGKHIHVAEQTCIQNDCSSKKCLSLCEDPGKFRILGHNTHKPPIGCITRFIAKQDANGFLKDQYFVKTNKKIEIAEKEKQQYSNEILPDSTQQVYLYNHIEKYE